MSKKCLDCKEEIKFTERNGLKTYQHKFGYCLKNGCLTNYYRNHPKGIERVKNATIKATKTRRDLEVAKSEYKGKKSLEWLKVNIRNKCHEFIKLRDKGRSCISCGVSWHKDFHAGHYKKAELYSSLKYAEENINGQCERCNMHLDGNEKGYREGLINRYSRGFLDLLDSKALLDKKLDFKWDREELKKIGEYYDKKIKELRK